MSTIDSSVFADTIRRDFPVFRREVAGKPIAFFDGPGGSQVPRAVAEAVAEYLTLHNANTHGHFLTSEESDAAVTAGREAMADFVGGSSPGEIVFGANMTTLAFHLSRSLGRDFAEGDDLLPAGRRLSARDVGLAAASGCSSSSGSESNRRILRTRLSTFVSIKPFSPSFITVTSSVVARATTGRPISIASRTERGRLV